MGKKCASLILTVCALASAASAQTSLKRQGAFEILFGKYEIADSRFAEVYEKGGTIRGIALSSSLPADFDFYAEIREFDRKGSLTFTQETSNLVLVPLTLGLRYILPGSVLLPYAGGGADFYFYYENNPIATTMNIVSGYHVLAGLYLQFGKNSPLRLNGRIKFTRAKAREGEIEVELGGLEYGGGISIAF